MFEKASRLKLRFSTSRGSVAVEDLWDMPLRSRDGFNLDQLAVGLYNETREQSQSFVEPKEGDAMLTLRFDIVKHVIDVKLKEAKEREEARAKAAKKARILAILHDKQDAALKEKSIEELEKELADL